MSNTSLLGSFGGQGNSSLMFRNKIINGAMVIDQRNAGASVQALNTYTVDRWAALNSTAPSFTIQQNAGAVTPPAGFTNYLGCTITNAVTPTAGQRWSIQQSIEGFNVADLAWGTANAQSVAVSFWARSSLTGTFGGVIRNSAGNRAYPFTYSVSAANTWEYKTVIIPGDTSGTWLTNNGIGLSLVFSLGAGSSLVGAAGSWAGSDLWSATGSVNVIATAGATLYITGVQLEAETATPFERRPIGTELVLCQRYYERGSTIVFATSEAATSIYLAGTANFKVSKRVSPNALTTTDAAGNAGRYSDFSAGTDTVANNVNAVAAANINENAARLRYLYQPAGASKNNLFCFWTADAEL